MSNKRLRWALVLALLIAPPGISLAAEGNGGKQLYLQYCSSCHGGAGKGDGTVSRALDIRVPDLTVLAKKNHGIYPTDEVMATIDGRRSVRGHGDRDMPVWGQSFYRESQDKKYAELTTLLKVKVIAEFIATLQRK